MKKVFIIAGVLVLLIVGIFAVKSFTGNAVNEGNYDKKITIQVKIPCPGHAGLITNNLKTINGVEKIEFNLPNNFAVYYDSNKTSPERILEIGIFKEYPAKIVN